MLSRLSSLVRSKWDESWRVRFWQSGRYGLGSDGSDPAVWLSCPMVSRVRLTPAMSWQSRRAVSGKVAQCQAPPCNGAAVKLSLIRPSHVVARHGSQVQFRLVTLRCVCLVAAVVSRFAMHGPVGQRSVQSRVVSCSRGRAVWSFKVEKAESGFVQAVYENQNRRWQFERKTN